MRPDGTRHPTSSFRDPHTTSRSRRDSRFWPYTRNEPVFQFWRRAAAAVRPAIRFSDSGFLAASQVCFGGTPEHGRSAELLRLRVAIEAGEQAIVDRDLYRFHVDILSTVLANRRLHPARRVRCAPGPHFRDAARSRPELRER